MKEIEELSLCVREGNQAAAKSLTQTLVQNGTDPQTILNDALISAMEIVGKQMSSCEIYLPDVLQSALAMRASMEILKPLLIKGGVHPIGKIVLGTVKGDMHDIGKNIVGFMMQGAGLEVIDLGVNVTPEKFVEAITKHSPSLLGMSALLTTTMGSMKKTIEAIQQAGFRSSVKILIGGAPVTQRFADEIGADGFARDAGSAAAKAKEMLKSV